MLCIIFCCVKLPSTCPPYYDTSFWPAILFIYEIQTLKSDFDSETCIYTSLFRRSIVYRWKRNAPERLVGLFELR